jgi:hypothetical protein
MIAVIRNLEESSQSAIAYHSAARDALDVGKTALGTASHSQITGSKETL